jgi:5'-nucleotidase
VGTFTVTRSGMDATITQTSLSDDATPAAEIKRTVSWGDGSAPQVWQTGTELTHNYAALGRYVPTVTLTDNSGNSVTLTLRAAVFGDTDAPVGNFASGPPSAFAGWTKVSLNVESLTDNYTPSELVTRTVSWGDGTTEAWKDGATLTHVYAVAGTFTPTVVLVDEADNTSKVAADPITVTVDATGPVVTVKKPKAAAKVKSWRTVKGTVTDAGVGVASVAMVAIQKRDGKWFAYSGATKKWTKAGTKGKAWKKAVAAAATVDKAAWSVRLNGLRKGRLELRATGTDLVANASKLASRSALLRR